MGKAKEDVKMKPASKLIIKITAHVSLLTIIKWRLLGLHKPRNNIMLPEGYEGKESKLFKVEVENNE